MTICPTIIAAITQCETSCVTSAVPILAHSAGAGSKKAIVEVIVSLECTKIIHRLRIRQGYVEVSLIAHIVGSMDAFAGRDPSLLDGISIISRCPWSFMIRVRGEVSCHSLFEMYDIFAVSSLTTQMNASSRSRSSGR